MFTFNKKYCSICLTLFVVEVFIAVYVHDDIIRPYAGDLLAVIFLYCGIKSIINAPVKKTAISVLLFSFILEISQYFHILYYAGLQNCKLANVVLGNSFAWIDLLAYTLGTVIILGFENGPHYCRVQKFSFFRNRM